jgi:hypothetical protein
VIVHGRPTTLWALAIKNGQTRPMQSATHHDLLHFDLLNILSTHLATRFLVCSVLSEIRCQRAETQWNSLLRARHPYVPS